MRINIKQNTKRESYFDVTVRGDTEVEISERLNKAVEMAVVKCEALNRIEVGKNDKK